MAVTLYGIPNCDTVKKARAWLDERGVAYTFYDYKKQGVPADRLDTWIADAGWDKVLNRAGTTFRKLPEANKQDLGSEKAAALMIANPSAIKRPIVEHDAGLLVGFVPTEWQTAFA